MFQRREKLVSLVYPVPRYSEPTTVETKSLACRCYATIPVVWDCVSLVCVLCCYGVALDVREGRCGYRSYNTTHKARGQLMTCSRMF